MQVAISDPKVEVVMREEPTLCSCGGRLTRTDYPQQAIYREFTCTSCGEVHHVRMDFSAQPSARPYPGNPDAICTCAGPWDWDFCPRHG